jgi:hypothetical protein
VHWNRNGEGQAYIGGQWRSIDPDNVTRVRNADGTTTLTIDENGRQENLLRVDPRAPALRADAGTLHDPAVPGGDAPVRHAEHVPTPSFESPYLNRLLAAVSSGDEAAADRALRDYTRSPEGVAFLERHESQTPVQQAEERAVQQQGGRQV